MPVYRTATFASPGMPPGIPFIVANEAAERCSCYGMRVILAVHIAFLSRTSLVARGAAVECVGA
ncbi:MAG: hypothetical protein KJO10_08820 [Gammaproteobacteria bacterium]|nr:hypothetical protein [Gammaproteobacteria bacterium]